MVLSCISALFFVRAVFNFQRYCTLSLPDGTALFHDRYQCGESITSGCGNRLLHVSYQMLWFTGISIS